MCNINQNMVSCTTRLLRKFWLHQASWKQCVCVFVYSHTHVCHVCQHFWAPRSWAAFGKEPGLCSRWEPDDISSLWTEWIVTGMWNSSGWNSLGKWLFQTGAVTRSDKPSSHCLRMSRPSLNNLSDKPSPKFDCLHGENLFLPVQTSFFSVLCLLSSFSHHCKVPPSFSIDPDCFSAPAW